MSKSEIRLGLSEDFSIELAERVLSGIEANQDGLSFNTEGKIGIEGFVLFMWTV